VTHGPTPSRASAPNLQNARLSGARSAPARPWPATPPAPKIGARPVPAPPSANNGASLDGSKLEASRPSPDKVSGWPREKLASKTLAPASKPNHPSAAMAVRGHDFTACWWTNASPTKRLGPAARAGAADAESNGVDTGWRTECADAIRPVPVVDGERLLSQCRRWYRRRLRSMQSITLRYNSRNSVVESGPPPTLTASSKLRNRIIPKHRNRTQFTL